MSLASAKSSWDWPDDAPPFVVLATVSAYPAQTYDYRLGYRAGILSVTRHRAWGVSDHTTDPTTVPAAAVALGACVVEKHSKMKDWHVAPDASVSIVPADFASMVRAIRLTERAVRG